MQCQSKTSQPTQTTQSTRQDRDTFRTKNNNKFVRTMFGHESKLKVKEILVYTAEQEIAIEKHR